MIYPSIDKLLNIVNSKYALVHVVANRSRDIKHRDNLQMPKNKYKSQKKCWKSFRRNC